MAELPLNALILFGIPVLVGLGLALVFGLKNVTTMAHGAFVVLGAFTLSLVQGAAGASGLASRLVPAAAGWNFDGVV